MQKIMELILKNLKFLKIFNFFFNICVIKNSVFFFGFYFVENNNNKLYKITL